MYTENDIMSLSDEDLGRLTRLVSCENDRREKNNSKFIKSELSRKNKRDLRCPKCLAVLNKNGKRTDGVQKYICPVCRKQYSDTSFTSLSASKLTPEKIKNIITLIVFDCPDWVISLLVGVTIKTVQYWVDRCLDSANKWANESILKNLIWIDEMQFAPVRAKGIIDSVFITSVGKISKNIYIEIAIDSSGYGFCKKFSKAGMPTKKDVYDCLGKRIEIGSVLTHDGAVCHNLLVKELNLVDDWCKCVKQEKDYERKMLLMNNCCSYLRHAFESHKGIKYAKLEVYANFFLYRWSHVRKYGVNETINYLYNRVCGTPKSHIFATSFSKSSMW